LTAFPIKPQGIIEGDGMEPKSPYLEFYEKKRLEFKSLSTIDELFENDPEIKKRLQQAKKFHSLKKLCGGDEEHMFWVLRVFLFLPTIDEAESFFTDRRKQLKNEPATVKGYMERLIHKGLENISYVKFIAPEINEEKFKEKLKEWAGYKVKTKIHGRDDLDDAIEFVCMIDPELDRVKLRKKMHKLSNESIYRRYDRETINKIYKYLGADEKNLKSDNYSKQHIGFNELLSQVFEFCKEKTEQTDNAVRDRMIEVLNSLGIKTKQGKLFTNKNLAKYL
jgi:hypothetical protein